MSRDRIDYMVTVFTVSARQTWMETAKDAKGAALAARRHCAGAVGIEVRRQGSSLVLYSWGDRTARPAAMGAA